MSDKYKVKILRQCQVDGKAVKVGEVIEVDKTTRNILCGSKKAEDASPPAGAAKK